MSEAGAEPEHAQSGPEDSALTLRMLSIGPEHTQIWT